eukprot:CAMPEP_0195083516 /NCGR_PEP_ID=MMETSP0448-20130528/24448_1 /TAXON_ID=66468 /ORGANISM="Heterocapsa triquestra, Strain CCMP 448" /LENGTH=46 /DNA_ID= /DNA_START= /DNA_END= /DNA_ORIENTATION=
MDMPSTAFTFLRNSSSGAKPDSSQAPNLSASTEVITLKSAQPPQTT